MTKLAAFSFICIILSANIQAVAADGWTWANPLPQGNALLDADFANASLGLAVGSGGVVLRTVDGGLSWNMVGPDDENNFFDVAFADEDTAFAVGNTIIYRSTDAGLSWSKISDGSTPWLEGVAFDRASGRGAIVGWNGALRWTEDRGQSWTVRDTPQSVRWKAIAFADSETVFGVGNGGEILRSLDGGATWLVFQSTTTSRLEDICFLSPTVGIIVGWNSKTLHTSNGGLTWSPRTAVAPDTILYGVTALGELEAVVIGNDGTFLRTIDGGTSYQPETPLPFGSMEQISSFGVQSLLATGSRGQLALSTDGGLNWENRQQGSTVSLLSVDSADTQLVVASGLDGKVLRSIDAGRTWTEHDTGTNETLNGVAAPTADIVFAGGLNGSVVRSSDGGVNWSVLSSGVADHFWDLDATDALHAWAVGGDMGGSRLILATSDGGNSWVEQHRAVGIDFYQGVDFVDNLHGWAVSFFGEIVATTDGGATWNVQFSKGIYDLTAVDFIDTMTGHVVGGVDGPGFLSTTDGGATWNEAPAALGRTARGLDFFDAFGGTIVGLSGFARTESGGGDWSDQSSPLSSGPTDVSFLSRSVAIAVGGGGQIVRSESTGWPVPVDAPAVRQSPARVALHRNIPNPFNPRTSIRFSIAEAGPLRLTLYEVNGRLVRTLVAEPLLAGMHTRIWDGHDDAGEQVASGVYFVRVESRGAVAASKVVLVR